MLMLLISLAFAKTVKVAVLDTGFDKTKITNVPMCESFNDDSHDVHGHGTNVVGLIQKHAGKDGFCFYIYKVIPGTAEQTIKALADAIAKKVDIINYSGGGPTNNSMENQLVKLHIDLGGVFIAASGNSKKELTKDKCNFYPACSDPRVIVVGNNANRSNYGPMVDHIMDGNEAEAYGIKMSGSSQSAALFTGFYTRLLVFKNRLDNR